MAGQNFKIGVDDKEALDAFTKLEKQAKMFESTMVKLGDKIDNVFEATNLEQYKQAISSQISVVESLTKEYDNLVAKRDEWASKGVGKTFTNEEIKQQQAEYANFEKQLKRIDKELQSETKELEKQQISLQLIEKEYDKVSSKSVTYLTQLKNIREEMATMVDASGNVSTKDIDRYNELKGKLGELGTAYRRVQQEQKLVTQAGNSMVLGITQGLQAIAGTFTLIQGLSSLISSDSEDVAEAQKKLQQAMAITMGIQQVSVALHSTSNLRIGLVAKATNLLTIAQNRLAIAFNGSTIAARAFMGAVTLGIGVAITAAISAYNKYADAQEKAAKAQKEFNTVMMDGAKNAQAEKVRTELLYEATQNTTLSYEDRTKAVKQLQSLYPSYLGNLTNEEIQAGKGAEAYKKLKNAILEAATARAAQDKMVENAKKMLELDEERIKIQTRIEEQQKYLANNQVESFDARVAGAQDFGRNYAANLLDGLNDGLEKIKEQEDEIKKQNERLKSFITIDYIVDKPKEEKAKKPSTKEAEKAKKEYDQLILNQDRALAKDREELERSQIDKRIKMLQYEYKKRIEQIRAEKDAILEIDRKANVSMFEEREKIALEYYEKAAQKENESQEDANLKSLDSFKSYFEQRQDIIDKYNKHTEVAKSLGLSKDVLENILKEQNKELSKLDFSKIMKTQDLGGLFEDLSKKSTESISVIIAELKRLRDANIDAWSVEELKIFNDQISKGEEISRDRSPLDSLRKGLEEYQQASEEIEYTQSRINELDEDSVDYNDELAKLRVRQLAAMDAQTSAQQKINNAVNSMGKGVKDISGAMGDAVDMLGNFGIELNDSISTAIKGLGQMGDALAELDVTKPGSIITSSIKWISGLGNIVSSFFGGGKKEITETQIREYEALTSSIERSIQAQKELLNVTAGIEAQKAADEAIEMLNRQKDAARNMYVETVDSYYKKNRTLGVRMRKDLEPFRKEIENIGVSWDKIVGSGRMEGLVFLSGEELAALRDMPQVWAAIDDEARKYLETIIESDEAALKLREDLKEAFTGLTFEGFLDTVTNEISKFKGDITDLGDFTEETLRKSLINAYKQTVLREAMQPLYDDLAKVMSKDIKDITEDDISDWSKRFEDIIYKQNQDLKDKLDKLGIDLDKEEITPPKASQGYQVSMSQDTGNEILGLVRNMQMIGLNQEQELIKQSEFLSTFGMQFGGMQQELESISSISLQSMYYLRDIEKHTKTLHEVGDILSKIEKNTQ